MEVGPARDRRRRDRRSEDVRLADFTVPRVRKALVTAVFLLAILALLGYMLRDAIVAIIAGIVLGAYLLPLQDWLEGHVRNRQLAALATITTFTVPLVAILTYGWIEVSEVAAYLEVNREFVTRRLTAAIQQLPFAGRVDVQDQLSAAVAAAADQAAAVVEGLRETLDIVVISIAVFLFTVFYILTDHERILTYLQRKVPGRYGELVDRVTRHIRAVVYGALYATFLTQLMKAAVVLVLNLAWDVPLAFVLAGLAFFIGFFPIVGSWIVYVPVSIYVAVFTNDVTGGLAILVIGFVVNTLLLSMYLRPKIAAERSRVLNFYWMFIALVTGVYTFGLVGIIIGPILLAVVKALFDAITGEPAPTGLALSAADGADSEE